MYAKQSFKKKVGFVNKQQENSRTIKFVPFVLSKFLFDTLWVLLLVDGSQNGAPSFLRHVIRGTGCPLALQYNEAFSPSFIVTSLEDSSSKISGGTVKHKQFYEPCCENNALIVI